MFDIIFKPFAWLLLQLYNLFGNFGVAVIFFSIIANLILLPLHIKGKKSMMRTTRLQPKLQALQKQYANDRQKQTELMQKLYQEEGINPLGGCGWSLLPFPIFLILYAVLREPLTHLMSLSADQISQVAQLLNYQIASNDTYSQITLAQMIHDNFDMLSQQIPGLIDINFNFLGINLSEIPNWQFWIAPSWSLVIPILSGVASWVQQLILQKNTQQTQAANQGGLGAMMKIMPLMSVWFGFIMPASMGVYWIINSIISAIRELILNNYYQKKFDEEDARKEAAAQRRREQEKAERAERIARQQEIAAQQRASSGRPKGKKKKHSQKAVASSSSSPVQKPETQPDSTEGSPASSDKDWNF